MIHLIKVIQEFKKKRIDTVFFKTRLVKKIDAPSAVPEVCYNDKYNMTQDGNSTYLGRFLCPTDRSMRGDKTYCCGKKGQQYCCTFWEEYVPNSLDIFSW